MLTHPTLDQLRTLQLDGMAQAFIELEAQDKARDLAHAEWLALLLDRESANRQTRRFQSRLRAARLASQPSVSRGCRLLIADLQRAPLRLRSPRRLNDGFQIRYFGLK